MVNILHFTDGQETLDFLFRRSTKPRLVSGCSYILLLDIRMPKVNGVEVLRKIKQDRELCKIPVIMLTTTGEASEVENCHRLGCGIYVTKPVDYDKFADTIDKLGRFLMVAKVPRINGISS